MTPLRGRAPLSPPIFRIREGRAPTGTAAARPAAEPGSRRTDRGTGRNAVLSGYRNESGIGCRYRRRRSNCFRTGSKSSNSSSCCCWNSSWSLHSNSSSNSAWSRTSRIRPLRCPASADRRVFPEGWRRGLVPASRCRPQEGREARKVAILESGQTSEIAASLRSAGP